jgi:hypothetical protein
MRSRSCIQCEVDGGGRAALTELPVAPVVAGKGQAIIVALLDKNMGTGIVDIMKVAACWGEICP